MKCVSKLYKHLSFTQGLLLPYLSKRPITERKLLNNIYRVTVNYLEPTSIHGMVIATSVEDAAMKFRDATGFDTAPPEYQAEIESIELIEENIPENVTSFDEYRLSQEKKVLN